MHSKYCVWFDEVGKDDGGLVGGKGANLGEMTGIGLPVPPGFIVTSGAYYEFLQKADLKQKIADLLDGLDHHNSKLLQKTAKRIRGLIEGAHIPEEIAKEIFKYYHQMSKRENIKTSKRDAKNTSQSNLANQISKKFIGLVREPLVAIRSSATAEDLPEASFAGQQETYLNVHGDANVLHHVRKAWASLFTARALFYREENGFDHLKVGIALPIQRMIESDASGIMFTLDPVTNNKNHIVIEAIYGLGELIVQGAVTPDHYVVDKNEIKIVQKHIGKQDKKLTLKNGGNQESRIRNQERDKQKVKDSNIIKLAEYGKKIEEHYYFPQDIEWAIENGKIYILQTRPVTTTKIRDSRITIHDKDSKLEEEMEIVAEGSPASPGIASGHPKYIASARDIDKIKGGDILLAEMTDPDFVPAMRRAVAVVTEKGGRTSHAAIVSRELGIPAVVGAMDAIKKLGDFKTVTVNGSTGKIYKGGLSKADRLQIAMDKKVKSQKSKVKSDLETATHVYCNLATTERVKEVADMHVDGIGLLRAEFMIAQLGYHPKYLMKQKREKEFIDHMSENLVKFCKTFGKDRPVVYRATDLKSNEYRDLKGGDQFEPDEENPMLGYRGAYRYINDPQTFKLELKVLKQVRGKYNCRNLWLMIPFVRTVEELKEVKKLLQEADIHRSGSFKLWIMVELPSNVILIKDFIKAGIDGISIGSNDLTQLTLGVDRDSEKVAEEFNELDPAVLWSLKRVIKAAGKHKITSSICGQAPSDYPDLVEKLVRWGVTSVSVNPDAIDRTRETVYNSENKL